MVARRGLCGKDGVCVVLVQPQPLGRLITVGVANLNDVRESVRAVLIICFDESVARRDKRHRALLTEAVDPEDPAIHPAMRLYTSVYTAMGFDINPVYAESGCNKVLNATVEV